MSMSRVANLFLQVVTCKKMKMSGGLGLVPRGLETRLTKPSG